MALLESVTAFSWALLSYRKSAVISITYTDQNLQGISYKWEIPFLYPDQIDSVNSTHSEDTGRHKEKQKKPEDQALTKAEVVKMTPRARMEFFKNEGKLKDA